MRALATRRRPGRAASSIGGNSTQATCLRGARVQWPILRALNAGWNNMALRTASPCTMILRIIRAPFLPPSWPCARVGAQARILAVLEPRSNTMKLGVMKAQLPASLEGADLIFGYGAATGRHALGWDLQAALAPLAGRAQAFDEIDALVCAVSAAARPGDHVLIMSNGSFANVHAKLMERLRTRTGARHRS